MHSRRKSLHIPFIVWHATLKDNLSFLIVLYYITKEETTRACLRHEEAARCRILFTPDKVSKQLLGKS